MHKFKNKTCELFIIGLFGLALFLCFSPSNGQFSSRIGDEWVIKPNFTSLRFSKNFTCYIGRVLFPYGPECADEEMSKEVHRSRRIDLNFELTFMGHKFNHLWVNQHGFISFQDSFYGVSVSKDDWPQPKYPYVDDPVFIAPLYAQTDLVEDRTEDVVSTKYGRVLYKVIERKDLPLVSTEEEKFVYEMAMKVLNDGQMHVRESVASAEHFIASHAIIVTWKSVAFSGNSLNDLDLKPRNTFQCVILTNKFQSYAIFNYENVTWYASASQGGNPETGTGGKAARIGFNRGNGTLWYGFRPFSENAQLLQNIEENTNSDQPGRYVFRIDEWIQPGGCINMDYDQERSLHIWPRTGNLLGGQEVNITGPCLHNASYFYCKWGDSYDAPITIGEAPRVNGKFSKIRGRCIQPLMYFIGRLNLSVSIDGGLTYPWKAEYTVVDPLRYPAKVELVNIQDWHQRGSPPRLIVRWNRFDLSYAESDPVNIELWGYYENEYTGPHWDLLQVIGTEKNNKGSYGFDVAPNRAKNRSVARIYKVGAIKISLHDSREYHHPNYNMTKHIWSALHPIGWWRNDEMKFYYDAQSYVLGNSRGKNWAEDQCRWWHQYRKYDRFWLDELEICPTTLLMAIGDMGVWAPDPNCNMYGGQYNELNCLQHPEAVHCVVTMRRTASGSGNRCCYDKDGNLMYTNDTDSGSTPDRHHSLGMPPFNKYGIVPGLSHYLHDIVPYYLCCKWSNLCEAYLYLRQTKDAKGYKEPRPAVAYGDPHLMTFDGKDYTFNGKGEFTLFRSRKYNFQLQARFEQPPNATFCLKSSGGQINATRITAIAAGQDDSDIVEVRARIYPTQTKVLGCDVLVNGKTYYFNYTEEKMQIFKNVYILSPLSDLYQSNITIMFNTSGVGVQVQCVHGLMHVRTSAPYSVFKDTAGLFGYWDNITANDFMHPDNSTSQLTLKPDFIYQGFGLAWRLKDESESLFTYSGSWNFDTFHDYKPIIREWQKFRPWFTAGEIPFPSNVSFTKEEMIENCKGDEQCLFDSAAMGSLEIGEKTMHAHRYYRLLHDSMKAVNSCGIYLMQGGIRSTTKGNYLTGSKMRLSCKPGYILFGWPEFYCNWNATWIPTNGQWLAEFRDWPYCEHYHITAIRWTAIGISIVFFIFIVLALIRYFLFRKESEYVVDEKDEVESYTFQFPQNEKEVEALSSFDYNNYSKDGFEHSQLSIKKESSFNIQNDTEKNQQLPIITTENNDDSLSSKVASSDVVKSSKFEKPCIIIGLPHPGMEQVAMSSKVFSDEPQYNIKDDTSEDESEVFAKDHPRKLSNSSGGVYNVNGSRPVVRPPIETIPNIIPQSFTNNVRRQSPSHDRGSSSSKNTTASNSMTKPVMSWAYEKPPQQQNNNQFENNDNYNQQQTNGATKTYFESTI